MCQENNGGGWWLTRTGFDPLKAFLSFLLACLGVSAATPSFNSFEPTQFSTNGLRVSLQEPLVVTNLTVVSNLLTQNIYTTNIYNDITFNGRVTFNTNVTFVVGPTNVLSSSAFDGARGILWEQTAVTNVFLARQSSGDIDIWTVPSGNRAVVLSALFSTTNTTTTVLFSQVNSSATYYRLSGTTQVTTNAPSTLTWSGMVFEGGDVISFNSTQVGISAYTSIRYWTNTVVGPYSPRVLGATLAGSDYTVYTCPAGRRAVGMNGAFSFSSTLAILVGATSTTGMTHTGFIVPDGLSADDSTQLFNRPVTTAQGATVTIPFLNEGDSVVVRTSSNDAGQSFWLNIIEIIP